MASPNPFAFLADADLYDLIGRMARKRFPDSEATAKDVRQGAYLIAMELIEEGGGPTAGFERGWMCCILKNHAKEFWRVLGQQEPVLDTSDEPDIPVEDQRVLLEAILEKERVLDLVRKIARKHPKHAAAVQIEDGRKGESGAKDAAARQAKGRARQFFLAAIGTASLALLALLRVLRPPVPTPNNHLPPVWTDTTLAAASRELATRYCGQHRWQDCLAGLEQARALDPAQDDAAMAAERMAAAGALRDEGLAACEKGDWRTCADNLEVAARYDHGVGADLRLQLGISEAHWHLHDAPVAPRKVESDAKGPRP